MRIVLIAVTALTIHFSCFSQQSITLKNVNVGIIERGDSLAYYITPKADNPKFFSFFQNLFYDGCKYSLSKIDQQSGDLMVETRSVTLYSDIFKGTLKIQAFKFKAQYVLKFDLTMWKPFAVEKDDPVYIRLTNDIIYEYYNYHRVVSKFGITGWKGNIMVPVTHDLHDLKSIAIDKIRFHLNKEVMDFDIKPKNQVELAESLGCVELNGQFFHVEFDQGKTEIKLY